MRLILMVCVSLLVGCSKPELQLELQLELQPEFVDVEGNGISLAELQSKPLIVNYWATWCAPCIKEIPELNELAEKHANEINVIGVNFDQPGPDEQLKQVRKMKIEFPVLAGEPSENLGVTIPRVLPTTYVFAAGGKLVATLVGPQTGNSLLAALEADG
ncbi:MAG: thiol-disulfide isomerase/thioredoxin [Candidatus Azotimanducaceae bacterium]|jgi:thiol-disulfide isomerase/thioredoxin